MKFTEQERDFLKQEFADLCHAAINSMITAGSFVRAIDRIEAIVSERITPEPKAMTEQEITNKEIYELECILEKVRKGGFMYTFAEAINDIENIFKPFMVQSAQITPEPGETIKPVPSIPIFGGNSVASDRTEPGESGQSAEEKVQWNEYEYAKQLAMLIHARCYPELPQWEPIPDLMGLLTQIDNMVCGLERKVDTLHSAEEWDKAEGILGRCTCAEIYTSRRMTDPNCAWCEYHVDLIKAMRLHASQVCADKEREIEKCREAGYNNHKNTEHLESEIDRLNESMTVMLRKNADLTEAIRWALGENGEFIQRKSGQGSFYWRTELRKRSNL